jgi:heme exporter protein D
MNWGTVENFFHMGGNGLYVWGSYAMTLALMVLEPVMAARRRKQALRLAREQAEGH